MMTIYHYFAKKSILFRKTLHFSLYDLIFFDNRLFDNKKTRLGGVTSVFLTHLPSVPSLRSVMLIHFEVNHGESKLYGNFQDC